MRVCAGGPGETLLTVDGESEPGVGTMSGSYIFFWGGGVTKQGVF